MKALAWLCLVVGLAVAGSMPAEAVSAEAPSTTVETETGAKIINVRELLRIDADEGLTVISSNAYLETRNDGDTGSSCIIYAEIRNDTDHIVYMNGRLQFREGMSQPVLWSDPALSFMPLRIEPGQTAYFSNSRYSSVWYKKLSARALSEIWISLTDGPVSKSELRWQGVPTTAVYQDDSVVVETTEPPEWSDSIEALRVTFTNRTGSPLPDPVAVVAAYDAQGQLLYVAGSDMADKHIDDIWWIPDGSPCVIVDCIPRMVSEYMESNGIEVSEYRTIIYGNDLGGAL